MEKSTRSAIRSISVLHTPHHNIVIYEYVDCAACISNECGKNAKVETHIFVQIHAHTHTHTKNQRKRIEMKEIKIASESTPINNE